MKGVPIKFRAKGIDGKVYFGSIRKYVNCYAILGKTSGGVSSDGFVEVFEDSICQLCGYDADGKEIYEGDELEASNPDYAAIIPCHKVLSPYDGKFSLKGLSDFDIATWNIRLKGNKNDFTVTR